MLIEVLFIKANVWRGFKDSLDREWINNLWHYSYNLNLHNDENK